MDDSKFAHVDFLCHVQMTESLMTLTLKGWLKTQAYNTTYSYFIRRRQKET